MASEDANSAAVRRGRWLLIAVVAILTLAGAVLRIARLGHTMRYDESFTVLQYAFQPSPDGWFDYSTPNNHVLHTLLVRGVAEFNGVTPPAVRLPAFLAGVAMIPASAVLALRLTGRPAAAVMSAAMVCSSSLMVEYSVNARGYSLLCLLTVLAALAAVDVCRRPGRWRGWVAFCVFSALGALTIPIMAYPAGILAVAIGAHALTIGGPRRRIILKRLPLAMTAVAVFSAVLYLPVFAVSGAESVLANRFVTPQPQSEVLAELPGVVARALGDWTRDTSWAWRVAVAVGIAAAAVAAVVKRRPMLMLPPVAAVLLLAAAIAHGVAPFPRVWLFLLPLSLATSACGLGEVAAMFRPGRARKAALVAISATVLLCAADAGASSLRREYMISEDHRTLVDAERIIRDLHATGLADGRTALLSQLPSQPSLAYYSLLYAPEGVCSPADPRCVRAVAVVGHTQTLESVLDANSPVAGRFGPFSRWRKYPRAEVYVAPVGGR